MKKIKNVEAAFAAEGLDANAIEINGVPERHIEALKAMAKLFVVHDAVNPEFQPDFTNYDQRKYNPFFSPGSVSGSRFAYHGCDDWSTRSLVGSRLVSESAKAAEYIGENFEELYKTIMVYERPIKK